MIKVIWHKIISFRKANPQKSMNRTSEELGVSKSMVKRLNKRQKNRNKYPESEFWDSPSGQQFLKRLIVSAIYTFCIKGGIGSGRVEEFMKQIRVGTHAGISESSIYRLMKEIEVSIFKYKELVERDLINQSEEQLEYLEVVLGLDETWLDKMLLVCQELSSGYLFLKQQQRKEIQKAGGTPSKKSLNPSI